MDSPSIRGKSCRFASTRPPSLRGLRAGKMTRLSEIGRRTARPFTSRMHETSRGAVRSRLPSSRPACGRAAHGAAALPELGSFAGVAGEAARDIEEDKAARRGRHLFCIPGAVVVRARKHGLLPEARSRVLCGGSSVRCFLISDARASKKWNGNRRPMHHCWILESTNSQAVAGSKHTPVPKRGQR